MVGKGFTEDEMVEKLNLCLRAPFYGFLLI